MAIKPLTSAFIRLRNEAEWLPYCLESIENAFDEIVLFTQGEQTDGTDDICAESGHTWYLFPHLSYPNGPGHDTDKTLRNSVMNVDLRKRVERLEQAVADLQAKDDMRDKAEVKEEKKPSRARKLHEKPEY